MTQSPQQNINVARRRTLRCTPLYTVLLGRMEPRMRRWCVYVYLYMHICLCASSLSPPCNLPPFHQLIHPSFIPSFLLLFPCFLLLFFPSFLLPLHPSSSLQASSSLQGCDLAAFLLAVEEAADSDSFILGPGRSTSSLSIFFLLYLSLPLVRTFLSVTPSSSIFVNPTFL